MKYLLLLITLVCVGCGENGAQSPLMPGPVAHVASATCNPRADGFPEWSGYGTVEARCPNMEWMLAIFTSDTLPMTLTNQRLVSLTPATVAVPGLTVRMTAPAVPPCVQADLYFGITPADVQSGRVLINPADSSKSGFYPAFSAATNIGSSACQPTPCSVPATVQTNGIIQTGLSVEFTFTTTATEMVHFAVYQPTTAGDFPQTLWNQVAASYPAGYHVVPWQVLAISGQRRQVDDGCVAFPATITDVGSFWAAYPRNQFIDGLTVS